ncbi:hypothetical protein [Geminicoccus roseus]|nr:hypothetical protein [Geminicoccus roseus]
MTQIRRFADKLTSNVLITRSLALDEALFAQFIDPLAGLVMVVATA